MFSSEIKAGTPPADAPIAKMPKGGKIATFLVMIRRLNVRRRTYNVPVSGIGRKQFLLFIRWSAEQPIELILHHAVTFAGCFL